MKFEFRFRALLSAFCAMLALADTAHAYVGPGAGLGVIGTLIAFVGAVLLAIVGFVWYPVKRLVRKRQGTRAGDARHSESAREESAGEEEKSGSLSQ